MRERVPNCGATIEDGPVRASVSIDINPITRHVAEFLALRCAPDLLELPLWPKGGAAKEITESMAAFVAVRRALRGPERFGDRSIKMYDVGCGVAPRTAALFAFRTSWDTVAIDPKLRDWNWRDREGVRRVEYVPERIEDVRFEHAGLAVVTLVHAHVAVVDALRAIEAPLYLVAAIPCCQPHELPGVEPDFEYADFGCWSPKRRVKVWTLGGVARADAIERRSI